METGKSQRHIFPMATPSALITKRTAAETAVWLELGHILGDIPPRIPIPLGGLRIA